MTKGNVCHWFGALRLIGIAIICGPILGVPGAWLASAQTGIGLTVDRLRCEYLVNPLGIDVREPRLGWIVASDERGQKQTAYQVLVSTTREALDADKGDLWDTGKVVSDETALIPYAGTPLVSRTACFWKVRAWDKEDKESPWSAAASWSMGLLEPGDWSAKWVGQAAETYSKSVDAPAPVFRTTFNLDAKPVQAKVYVAAMGYYELHLNGRAIGDDVCSPPVSDYNKRAYYLTYDVTDAVKSGKNCLGLWLGRGWYCAEFPGVTHPGPIARVQLEVTLDSGAVVRIASDETWKTRPSAVRALGDVRKGNLRGERHDAQSELSGWDAETLDDSRWAAATAVDSPKVNLCALMIEPNRITETIAPVSISEIADNEYMVDFGRNLTGMIEFRLKGTAGEPVRMSFIERWNDTDKEWVDFRQRDEYIPRSDGKELFRNRFNYHAFRYVKVTGLAEEPKPGDIKALFVRTDYASRGSFQCSNDLLNSIYKTTMYTFDCVTAGGVSVDCPHRERLGYGGDGQITSKTALYAYDLGALYTKWLGNWRDVQNPTTGELPNIAPYPHGAGGGPTWGAICVLLPWDLYLHYGDSRVLRENYAMMKQYVAFLDSKSENGLLKPYGHKDYGFLGDWVAPGHDQGTGPWSPEEWRTFFNNCFYAYIADHLGTVAATLGETQDAARYGEQAAALRRATHERWFKPESNSYVEGGQAYLSFALLSGVVPESLRPAVLKNLEQTIVETNSGHIDAGMHGSMFLLRCLNEARRDDLVYLMTNQKTYPGWGYMLEQGGTTLWERWDGERSRIHSTLLAAGEWFPRGLGGIKPDPQQPGFRHVIIDPRPVADLTWAKASYDTIRGPVTSEWRRDGKQLEFNIAVPANATALLRIPAADAKDVTEGGRPAADAEGVQLVRHEAGLAEYALSSGKFQFVSAQ
jgi:alpha-L-rhamnosidase